MLQSPATILPSLLLAQANQHTGRIFWSVLLLAVAVIVLVAIAMLVRRFMLSSDEPDHTPGFTLAEMRRLRDAGELSDEEYERVRSALVGQTRGESDVTSASSELKSPTPRGLFPKPDQGPDRKAGDEPPDSEKPV